MKTLISRTLVVLLIFAFVLVPGNVLAQTATEPPFPVTVYRGTFTNADYLIVVPDPIGNWNGTLLVFAHGYTDETIPPAGLSESQAKSLAAQGYAVAQSAFRNDGFAVKEGLQNTLALTNRFNGLFGKPQRTILVGFSMGSVIALKGIEQYPGIYDGAISLCGVGGGTPVATDLALDLALAYQVALGWPEAWGTPGDVRDTIDYETEVLPVLLAQLALRQAGDPVAELKFEFIRHVLDLPPGDDFYPVFDPGNPPKIIKPGDFLVDMYFATEGRADIEQRANGAVSQNQDHVYSLSQDDYLYFQQKWGADVVAQAQGLLDAMNTAPKYAAQRSAREYVERYAAFWGNLKRPVVTLHTTTDPINPPFHELLYANTVAAAGKSDLLLQLYTDGVGHCQFDPEGRQLLAALHVLEAYLNTGMWPTEAQLAPLASLGFDLAYQPPLPYYLPPAAAGNLLSVQLAGKAAANTIYLPLAAK